MPINSKYSDKQYELILAEVTAVLKKHKTTPDLSLMIAGNLVTNILSNDVPRSQRKVIADKFSQALLSSIDN